MFCGIVHLPPTPNPHVVYEPEGVLTTTWEGGGGKFPLYFSESNISWDVISAW